MGTRQYICIYKPPDKQTNKHVHAHQCFNCARRGRQPHYASVNKLVSVRALSCCARCWARGCPSSARAAAAPCARRCRAAAPSAPAPSPRSSPSSSSSASPASTPGYLRTGPPCTDQLCLDWCARIGFMSSLIIKRNTAHDSWFGFESIFIMVVVSSLTMS